MTWIEDVQAMKPGDACEWRYPARKEWQPGTVVMNGLSGYWSVEDADGKIVKSLYAEHIRAPGGPSSSSPGMPWAS